VEEGKLEVYGVLLGVLLFLELYLISDTRGVLPLAGAERVVV
jgi:hypothetical protein